MDKKYDTVIIGAGINGVAIARALALSGKKVLIVEKSHIAAGASSNSSRLIHGGLRYLENFEFSLVKEALLDQKYLLKTYPGLVKQCPFYLPIYKGSKRPFWVIGLGLWLYGLLAYHKEKPTEVSKIEFLKQFEAIKKKNLRKIYKYFDAKTDDNLLTHTIAEEARNAGTEILEYTQITRIDVSKTLITLQINNDVVQTNILINSAGAWIDEVNTTFNLPSSYTIEKLSGIHLIINRALVPQPLILETSTKRIFFIIPDKDATIIGTTERSEDMQVDDIVINNEDIEYLLNQSNAYLNIVLTNDDIQEVYIGTRPIIKSKKNLSKMSREYKLDLHRIGQNKILNVYGGKLTTFHSLSKKAFKILD
ncbi:MAG: FAD-dependent oxidoreductase [Sulfurimonas sp.]|jgi:glycerol-3-phosphate dehydrogenase|nr:FAD-dependent oxidoreductase [Sulfurimonas sp.]